MVFFLLISEQLNPINKNPSMMLGFVIRGGKFS